MVNIQTERLVIRNFVLEDLEQLKEIILDKESSEYAVYDYQFPTSDSGIMEVIKWFSSGSNYLALYEISDDRLIGFVSLNSKTQTDMDMGFCIYSPFQRKGYATEACKAVIRYAFTDLNSERLTCGTANENYPSYNFIQKLGFKLLDEGIASFRKTPEGIPIDFVGSLFLLDKKDWLHTSLS